VSRRASFTDAIVLRSVDYRDADRILTLLTREHGKIAVLARSARRSKKRFGGALEPYALVSAEVSLSRGEVGTIHQATVTRPFPGILTNLGRIALAGAAIELVREATPSREPDERTFDATLEMLDTLSVSEGAREELLLAFEARLMSLLGFEPGLDTCARCGKRAPEGQSALFDPAVGSIVCRACGGGPLKLSPSARARMKRSVGPGFAAEGAVEWPRSVVAEVRTALSELVAHHLGRPLKGAAVVAQVRELD
jgi:DNA repair protein RecO (recombination protein O)